MIGLPVINETNLDSVLLVCCRSFDNTSKGKLGWFSSGSILDKFGSDLASLAPGPAMKGIFVL